MKEKKEKVYKGKKREYFLTIFFISLFNWYAVKIQVLLLEKNLFTKKFVREKNYIRTTMRVSSTNLIESITQTFETSS